MTELTQQQVEELIQSINDAEEPESISNEMVAEILSYLNEKYKAGDISLAQVEATISAIQIAISSLQTGLSGVSGNFESIDDRKTDKNIQTGRLAYPQAPVVVLASMGQELDSVGKSSPVAHVASAGDYIWDANNGIQYYKSIDDVKQIGPPQRGIVYTNAHSNRQYRWNGTTWLQVGGNDNDGTINQSVYQNMERLNDRLNALIRALANIAFTGQKPDEMELDWDGTKYIVSLDMTGLDGAEVQETYPKQVIEGNAATITIVPSNSEHILRNASYKERSNDQPTNATIADNKAVITIRNVRSDKTIYVLATASAKQQFTAAISDQRVSGTGSTSGIVEGSAWATVLSINDGEAEGTSILGVSAEMEGGGHIAVHNNTVSTDCVTGNITITVTVAVVEQMSVVLVGDDDLASVDVSKVGEGTALEAVVSPKTFCKFTGAPTVEMGGEPVLNAVTDNGDGTYTVSIAEVTGDVEITVAVKDYNVDYDCIRYQRDDGSPAGRYLIFGKKQQYMMSKMVPVVGGTTISFKTVSGTGALHSFGANGAYIEQFAMPAATNGSVNLKINAAYVRIVAERDGVSSAWIKDSAGNTIWAGSEIDLNALGSPKDFLTYGFAGTPSPNSQGIITEMGCIQNSNRYYTTILDKLNYQGTTDGSLIRQMWGGAQLAHLPMSLSPVIDLPLHDKTGSETRPFRFSCGGDFAGVAPFIMIYNASNQEPYLYPDSWYGGAWDTDKTYREVNISANFVKARLLFLTDTTEHVFILDHSDNDRALWEINAPISNQEEQSI